MLRLFPGTVLVSRNLDESLNTSPGFWNHLAIVINANVIVEYQAGIVEHNQGRGVIRTSLQDYMYRAYHPVLALLPMNNPAGFCAAKRAAELVGLPGRPGREYERFIGRHGVKWVRNCVSVITLAWGPNDRAMRRVLMPDGIMRFVGRDFKQPASIK